MIKRLSRFASEILAIVSIAICANNSYAQITYTNDYLSIQGAPKHSFYGLCIDQYYGLYWTCKTDNFFQLDLTPKNPRIAGTGDQIVFYNTDKQEFNSIQVANVYNYSDSRAKENIQTLSNSLSTIINLRPVSYTWKKAASANFASSISEVEKNVSYGPSEDNSLQYGFLAQEVEEILPEAIKTDEEGHKLINYTALIPLLVQSIQELHGIIDAQSTIISGLKSKLNGNSFIQDEHVNSLISCSPNPTHGDITFSYEIEDNCQNAFILISDLSGNQELIIDDIIGQSEVSKNLGDLRNGLHIATLIVNNKVTDSKQIIINK
ncbi:MAG: tail fiber domain-containing protein [Muribaculaceae bacterium]|nr:tail fiber domain-containing protein [Muribaculaceae bacterium]